MFSPYNPMIDCFPIRWLTLTPIHLLLLHYPLLGHFTAQCYYLVQSGVKVVLA